MTAYYVRSGASGSANGTSWANAYTTIVSALSGKLAGDIFYIAEDHAESTASSIAPTFPGTPSNPNLVYCVDHTGSVPPVSADLRTTASIATTGSSVPITVRGSLYGYGLQINPSSGSGTSSILLANNSGDAQVFENCGFAIASSGAGTLDLGALTTQSFLRLIEPTITFALTGNQIRIGSCDFAIKGGSIAATGTVPTTLFGIQGSTANWVGDIAGTDLSAFGSGKTIFGTSTQNVGAWSLRDCKLGASVTIIATPARPSAPACDIVNCDSGATNYRSERYRYGGTLTTETTIVRSGGASDGTTPVSHKIVTTANASWPKPFEGFPLAIWNDTVGSSVTATIYGIWGGGAVPNNDDIWIEAEYLGSSSSPRASFATGGKADGLASNAALSSDASSWGGSTTAFKMAVTLTPQQKGLIYVTVKAAKASSTFYVDPKIELS